MSRKGTVFNVEVCVPQTKISQNVNTIQSVKKGEVKLKEWKCMEVPDHENIGAVIKGRQNDGWRLHTYQAIGTSGDPCHYLLFEKGE